MMSSSNPPLRLIKLPSDVKSEQVVHRYGRFAVREISAQEISGRHEGKSQDTCFVAVEEMRVQTHGTGKVIVDRATKERSILSPSPEGVVLSSMHSPCPSSLSVSKSEMESNSNSFTKPVQVEFQNLDIVAASEALQQSNNNTHQQGNVISDALVSRLLLQNQALLDRLSTLDLPMTEYPPLIQRRKGCTGTASASFHGILVGHQHPPQHKLPLHRFSSDPSAGVHSHARLKNVLDQMREELDLAASQCCERDLELNAVREKNRSLNKKLQTEQSKVSALVSKLEHSQHRNRVLLEEVDYLSSTSVNNDVVLSHAPTLPVDISTRSSSTEDFSITNQQHQKHADMDGATPINISDVETNRKIKQASIIDCDSPIKYASIDRIPLNNLTPEKNLQYGGDGVSQTCMQKQRQQSPSPLMPQWDAVKRSQNHTPVPMHNQHNSSSSCDMTSNTYRKCGISGMSTSGPSKNSSRPEDVHAFIMSSFQQQRPL
eukprot:320883_1